MVRWSGSSAPSNSANPLTQNKDVDSGSGRASVLELGTTEMVPSCISAYKYLSQSPW